MTQATKLNFSQFVDLVLARVYDWESHGGAGKFFHLNPIADELQSQAIPNVWVMDAARVLQSRGLLRCIFSVGGAVHAELTGEGRLYVEEGRGTGIIQQYREHPGTFVIVHGEGNQVAAESHGAVSQTMTLEKERQPAFDLINKIRETIEHDASLGERERPDLLADLEAVRLQLKKRDPNQSALAALLEPLSQVASIAGQVATLIQLLNPWS